MKRKTTFVKALLEIISKTNNIASEKVYEALLLISIIMLIANKAVSSSHSKIRITRPIYLKRECY